MHLTLASIYHHSAFTGGNEHYFNSLATYLSSSHQVDYYASRYQTSPQYPYPLHPLPACWVHGYPLPHPLRTVSPLPTDIIHTTGSGLPLHFWASRYRHLVPTIHTLVAPTNPQNPLLRLGSQLEQNLIAKSYHALITNSPSLQAMLTPLFPHLPIFSIPLMLSSEFLHPPLSKKQARQKCGLSLTPSYVLTTASLTRHHYYKGITYLLEAFTTVPQAHLLIMGAGDQLDTYRHLSQKLGLSARVHFLGYVSPSLKPYYFQAANVFILPSTSSSEGFGIVNLEAMASKTPVITTQAVSAAGYFAHHRVVTLIPAQNTKAITQALSQTLKHPPQSQIARAYQFARRHTINAMGNNTLAVYRKVHQQWLQNRA